MSCHFLIRFSAGNPNSDTVFGITAVWLFREYVLFSILLPELLKAEKPKYAKGVMKTSEIFRRKKPFVYCFYCFYCFGECHLAVFLLIVLESRMEAIADRRDLKSFAAWYRDRGATNHLFISLVYYLTRREIIVMHDYFCRE